MRLQDSPFPLFDQVKAEHVVPGITKLLEELNADLDELEKTVQATWSSLVDPLERLTDRISRAWSTVSHLKVLESQICCITYNLFHLQVQPSANQHPCLSASTCALVRSTAQHNTVDSCDDCARGRGSTQLPCM